MDNRRAGDTHHRFLLGISKLVLSVWLVPLTSRFETQNSTKMCEEPDGDPLPAAQRAASQGRSYSPSQGHRSNSESRALLLSTCRYGMVYCTFSPPND